MEQQPTVKVTIAFQDAELDDVSLQEATENLYQQIIEVDGVEQANLIAVDNPPEGSRAVGGFLLGMLTAEVSPANIKTLFGFLSDRLIGKTVEMQVEAPDGRKLSIKASSQAEFEFAMKQAKDFFEGA